LVWIAKRNNSNERPTFQPLWILCNATALLNVNTSLGG
jgi:hypothetical protein